MMEADYDWYLEADLSGFMNKWVAIAHKKVILSAGSVAELLQKLDQKPDMKQLHPLITKVSGAYHVL